MFSKIQLLSALGALSMANLVSAHGHVMSWVIDGQAHAGFQPSNAKEYGATAQRPTDNDDQGFADHTLPMVACGGASPGTGIQTLDIKGGSSVVAKWKTWPESHKGPIIQYMANCGAANCDGIDAASLDWFKISESLFDGTQWPGEKIASTLEWPFEIPADLASGAYLVRHEIIAMHSTGMPQVYPVCFQANLVSSGAVVPTLTTTFPEAYKLNADFETWSLYGGDQSAFIAPGPAVYSGGGTAPAPAPAPSASASASTSVAPSASVPASSSAAVSSVSAPVASSSEVVVPSATATATVEYPAEPTVSTPTESEPVESASVPVESYSAPVESASSASSAPATPSASTPVTPAPGGDGAMGGAAPPITEDGTRFKVNGGSYNSRSDAVYASCMAQMNACKNWANSLPNAEVGAAFSSCDTQVSTCTSSNKKRDVINRYAKRSLRVL